jgi:ERCC4-type nuclease
LAFGRETLIQDRTRTSNNDSKEPTIRSDGVLVMTRELVASVVAQLECGRYIDALQLAIGDIVSPL